MHPTRTALLASFAATAAVLALAEEFSQLPGVLVAFAAAGRIVRMTVEDEGCRQAVPEQRRPGSY